MIKFSNISKAYASRILLQDVSFAMGPGERIALVGRNGSGKSTIFKLILGEEEPDSGEIVIPSHYKVGHLAQHLHFEQANIVDEVMEGLPHDRQDEQYRAKIILAGLGFSEQDFELPASKFSGGFQIRINLARLLLSEPNLLLLDEPTNYLDIISVRWIIKFLSEWAGEMIVVSHDRDFLDQVSTHTMLIHRKGLRKMRGNTEALYSQVEQDEERYEQTRVNEAKKRKDVEAFINRFRAKASKASQVQSRIKALERAGTKEALTEEDTLDFVFRETQPFHGKFLIEAQKISFGYQKENLLIKDLDITLGAGERIAIIGKNGRGKSTLLKLLASEIQPLNGSIRNSQHTRIGYFGQTNILRLNLDKTIEKEITEANDKLSRTEIRGICGAMMFSGDDALKRVSVLSGGERSRVLLGKIIAQASNLLLLDEPSNHLDMESIEALLEACQSYQGAIAIVTHSEYILRNLATKIIVFSQHGPIVVNGNYDYFLETIGWEEEIEKATLDTKPAKPSQHNQTLRELNAEEKRHLKLLKKEIGQIEDSIVSLERKQKKLEADLEAANKNLDQAKILEISHNLGKVHSQIEEAFEEMSQADQKYQQFIEK